MALRVRMMELTDIDSVYAIEMTAHRAPWSREILCDCVSVGYDCRVLEEETERGTNIVSYVICRYTESKCHVLNLCVAVDLQGKGYGRQLLQHVIDHPALLNTQSIILEVRRSNLPAIKLYQKMGFEQIDIKPAYYPDPHKKEDAFVLLKNLSSNKS